MSRHLPARPNLEHLRKQAKELLKELQQFNPSAQLADSQHALAREYGFISWPMLRASVEDRLAASARGARLFTGTWKADLARSTRHPANQFQRATIVFDLEARDLRGYAWDFPTLVAGQPLVCRGAYVIHNMAHDSPKARIDHYLRERGLRLADYKLKQFAERGFEPGAEIAKPRVLLVGEAAGIDIATGEGIAQAIEYGALAGPYLADAFERDNFLFSTWRQRVDGRHIGKQLRIRHLCYRVFYGRHRPRLERMLPRLETLFRVGVQDFAGVPLSKLALAHGAVKLLGQLAREGMRSPD